MKTVKTFAAFLMLAAFVTTTAMAQTDKKTDAKMEKMGDKKVALKDHVCTKACTKDKHVYAHGEKGHVCTDACKKMEKKGKM